MPDIPPQIFIRQGILIATMSSNLSTMSTNLATMASALATMSSSLTTMALTNASSTDHSTAQPESSRLAPIKQTVYILTFTACNWQGALDTPDGNRSDWMPEYSAHGTLGVYVSRESAKNDGRQWLMEALDNRLKGISLTDEERRGLEDQWYISETDEDGIWKGGWTENGDYLEKPREIFEELIVTLMGRVLETASDGADGDDGNGEGKGKGKEKEKARDKVTRLWEIKDRVQVAEDKAR